MAKYGGIGMIVWQNSIAPLGHDNLLVVRNPPPLSIGCVGIQPDTSYLQYIVEFLTWLESGIVLHQL